MARPRTPTVTKELAGTLQPCRANPDEPTPEPGIPLPPAHVSPLARKVWPGVAQLLLDLRVLTVVDGPAVEGLCEAYADTIRARAALDRDVTLGEELIASAGDLTYVTEGKHGVMIRARPEVAMVSDADRRLCMWLAKFGLTPADRSRVAAAAGGDKDDDGGEPGFDDF